MVNLGEAYRKLIGKTNKERTKNEQRTNKERTKNEQRTNKRRCEPHGQMEKERTKDGASRTGR